MNKITGFSVLTTGEGGAGDALLQRAGTQTATL